MKDGGIALGEFGSISVLLFFFFNDTATTEIYTLSLHDALPILADITPFKWQTDDDMDWNSWAYLESPNYKPATRLIHQLVDIVSKNGNLLLDIGPRPDGTIPEPVKERLL